MHVNTGGSQAWVGSFAGDYIAGLLPSTETNQRKKLSYDVTVTTGLNTSTYDIEIKDRILYSIQVNNVISRRSLLTGADLSNWVGPSGKTFVGIAKAGKFIYVKTNSELYRLDTTQPTKPVSYTHLTLPTILLV